jgi:hypothetical protein
MTRERKHKVQRDHRELALATALAAVGLAGIAVVLFGEWRPSPGGNPWLVPLLAFLILLPTAALMAWHAWRGSSDSAAEAGVSAVPVLAAAAWAVIFFCAVNYLGLLVGTFLCTALAMLLLAPQPWQAAKWVLSVSLLVAIAFWLMFTWLAPIVLRDPWLF